ncbi:MAG: thioredoxin domain-containing protein [Nanoarchaeota archaeon]
MQEKRKYAVFVFLLISLIPLLVLACSKNDNSGLIFAPEPGHEFIPQNYTADGRLIIYEFSDFQCPACGAAFQTVQRIKLDYAGRIQFIYKHFPLVNIHENAFRAAIAAECARDQDRFEEYHNVLFQNQQNLKEKSLQNYARNFGMDMNAFNSCLASKETLPRIQNDVYDSFAAGIGATPSFIIAGEKYEGALTYGQMKAAIDAKLGP